MIAIIPARGGSKRILRKNIRDFLGSPIIARTIMEARDSGLFEQIVVSTEDSEIARIARKSGAEILQRSYSLADDHTTTVEVISDAVDEMNLSANGSNNLVCCLYPVNPFLNRKRISQGEELLKSRNLDYVFTAKKFESSPARSLKIGPEGYSEMNFPENLNVRSQDLQEYYFDAAMFYLGTVEAWREKKSILNGKSEFIILGKYETLDIDDEEDWVMMENLYLAKANQKRIGFPVE